MKFILSFFIATAFFVSCKDAATKQAMPAIKKDSTVKTAVKKDFSQVNFASKKDMSCGMPLTAGLEDTVHYKGKIYGFCSAECKADFVKNASTYVK